MTSACSPRPAPPQLSPPQPASPRPAPHRRCQLAILASCLVPALAACSGAVAQVHLPPKPPAATTSSSIRKQPPASPRQQVIAALTGYVAALHAANLSKNPATVRRLLRPYLYAARTDSVIQTEREIWSKGEAPYGQTILHILSVRVVGRHAFVHDCDDTSGSGLENASTGQPVPGSAGISDLNIITRLELVRGRWIIEFQIVEDAPCKA